MPSAHKSFDGKNGIFRIGYLLMAGNLADKTFAFVGKAHYRRCQSAAGRIYQNLRLCAFHYRHDRVCRSQVYSYDF
jgi:hypothetical protein